MRLAFPFVVCNLAAGLKPSPLPRRIRTARGASVSRDDAWYREAPGRRDAEARGPWEASWGSRICREPTESHGE